MAKIDTSKIDGYAEMSAEDKLKALEGYEVPDPDYSDYVKKDTAQKWSSEAANYKKKYKELLTEEQRKEEERKESDEAIQKELQELRAEKALNGHISELVGLGYDKDTAAKVAKATVDGDFKKVYELQAKFIADTKKAVESETLKKTPAPNVGDENNEVSKDDFKKMSLSERQELLNTDPELFNSFTNE